MANEIRTNFCSPFQKEPIEFAKSITSMDATTLLIYDHFNWAHLA